MQPPQKRELESDSDDDPDYVPPADEPKPGRQRALTDPQDAPASITEEDEAKKKSDRETLWADFKASLSTPASAPLEPQPTQTVKIAKRYRFAGEDVTEVKEVPADSAEAKQWPRWQPSGAGPHQDPPPALASDPADAVGAPSSSADAGPSTAPPPKPAKRPGPRKPKTLLAPLPGAQKARRLTTLDKSAMDWRSHVEGAPPEAGLRDELDAHRRGGGYLEKVEFLQRVEQRKEEALEASRSTKRRKTIA
ncbi:BCNT domain-containing protein [Phanerochaete sordida]|uniref:SWR1-complex protein 5 n=1 Tax=Phanerochaete sordida TaxID=48140 RepID=A0A9P3LGG9_9APHY|nr:BCNT domain-containing protein [Phanerochaete sordida]